MAINNLQIQILFKPIHFNFKQLLYTIIYNIVDKDENNNV